MTRWLLIAVLLVAGCQRLVTAESEPPPPPPPAPPVAVAPHPETVEVIKTFTAAKRRELIVVTRPGISADHINRISDADQRARDAMDYLGHHHYDRRAIDAARKAVKTLLAELN